MTHGRLRRLRLRLGLRRFRFRFRLRRRRDAESRRCAAYNVVLDRCVDQLDLGECHGRGLMDDRRPHLGAFAIRALLLFTPCEFGREPFRTYPSGGSLGIRKQRTLHLFVLEARSGRRRSVKAPRVDEAVPLTAHRCLYRQMEGRPFARWHR